MNELDGWVRNCIHSINQLTINYPLSFIIDLFIYSFTQLFTLNDFLSTCATIFIHNHNHHHHHHHNHHHNLVVRVGAVTAASGSAYMEQGNTKVLCTVYGPRQFAKGQASAAASSSSASSLERGLLVCDLKYATFSCRNARRSFARETDEKELSFLLQETLSTSVRLETFPNSAVDIYITILENDDNDFAGDSSLSSASIVASAITCASVALAHAGVEMYDLVVACCATTFAAAAAAANDDDDGNHNGHDDHNDHNDRVVRGDSIKSDRTIITLIDCDAAERRSCAYTTATATATNTINSHNRSVGSGSSNSGFLMQGEVVVACMPSLNEIAQIYMNGTVKSLYVTASVQSCFDACNALYEICKQALLCNRTGHVLQ